MANIRIYELAKKLGVPNADVIKALSGLGVKEKKNHSSSIDAETAKKITQALKKPAKAKPAKKAGPAKPAKAKPAKLKEAPKATVKPDKPAKPAKKVAPKPEKAQPPKAAPAGKKAAAQAPKPQKAPRAKAPETVEPKPKAPGKPARAAKKPFKSLKGPGAGKVTMADVVTAPENGNDLKVPEKFEETADAEKMEKFRAKPTMQKAFQAIRKIESRKFKPSFRKHGKFKTGPRTTTTGKPQSAVTAPRKKSLKMHEGITVKEFAEVIGAKIPEVVKRFMELGYMANINQAVDTDAALLVADAMDIKLEIVPMEDETVIVDMDEDVTKLSPRSSVVTVMGHVDHGKTSLLDSIRKTKVTESEAGGITQHIGAYKVKHHSKYIVFLDTPGHEAFSALRARGAKVTDIVVLVVAADDGVKPQTVEAIDHAKAAGVPIIVAINKMDKPGADPTRVRNELAEHEILSEDWGGKNIFVEISAKQMTGIDDLLEMILLQSDIMELKANPDKPGRGVIIEARLDRGRGPVATVLVQSGTVKPGDAFVSGVNYGRVRTLLDDKGKNTKSAGPSTPAEVIGFSEVPSPGDNFAIMEDEKKARQIAIARLNKLKMKARSKMDKMSLDDLFKKIQEGQIKDLNLILKGDVHGSIEAIEDSLAGITHSEVQIKVIHTGVGAINESDVMLAAASSAIILGFNVRPDAKALSAIDREGVDVRLYSVIYEAIEDVRKALEGLLEPTITEKIIGRAEVRQTFQASKLGTIAGCYVQDGVISRTSHGVRVVRDGIVVHEGKVAGVKRFKEDVKEVAAGYECGVTLENFNDIKVGDILENFIMEEVATKL